MEERIIEGYKVRSLNNGEKVKIVSESIFQLILGFAILTFCIKLTFGVGVTYVMLLMEKHITTYNTLKTFEGTILLFIMACVIIALWRSISHFARRLLLSLRNRYVFVLDTDTNDAFIMLDEEFDEIIQHIRPLNNVLDFMRRKEDDQNGNT